MTGLRGHYVMPLLRGILFAAMVAWQPVQAADLQVSPITIQFAPTERAQAVWLTNTGRSALQAQVRIYAWTSTEEADVLEPTSDILASPPFVEVAPGARQLVRIVRASAGSPEREQAFRVVIDELPLSNNEGTRVDAETGLPEPRSIQFLLRYSVPTFIASVSSNQNGNKQVSGEWITSPVPRLKVTNAGVRRLRISQLVHIDASGKRTDLVPGLLGYVLPGHTRSWSLPPFAQRLPAGVVKARLDEMSDESMLALVSSEH